MTESVKKRKNHVFFVLYCDKRKSRSDRNTQLRTTRFPSTEEARIYLDEMMMTTMMMRMIGVAVSSVIGQLDIASRTDEMFRQLIC